MVDCEDSVDSRKSNTNEGIIGYCVGCEVHEEHRERANRSRQEYKKDVEENVDENKFYSMDMQKIIMLLHLPGIKTALFTQRIFVINQTAAPLGGGASKGSWKPIGFLWHEAIQGRNDVDVASVVVKFLTSDDVKE